MLKKISFSGFKGGLNNFSFGMLFSVFFHGTIFFATIFALPFVAKKPLELMPIVSVELINSTDTIGINSNGFLATNGSANIVAKNIVP